MKGNNVVVVGARGSFKYIAFYWWAERHVEEKRSSQFERLKSVGGGRRSVMAVSCC